MEQLYGDDGDALNFAQGYKPVQRVSQACQDCRKKKARCTGERPKCQNCRRLCRDCIYTDSNRMGRFTTDEPSSALNALASSIQDISFRLANIERLLQDSSAQPRRREPNSTEIRDARPVSGNRSTQLNDLHGGRLSDASTSVREGSVSSSNDGGGLVEQVSFTGLLPLPVLLETVDVYFTYCHNQPYSFFHETNFRQRLSRGEIPDHLLFAVLASAVRFSQNPFFEDMHEAAVVYANKSWKSIVSSCFSVNKIADLRTVQTLTLLSIFDFTGGKSRHGFAWVKVGLAVRIAQDMKLMMESAEPLPFSDQEERRRVFWSVYLLDKLISCGRARPPAILDASCQLQLPLDEATWRAGDWKATLTLQQLSCKALSTSGPHGPFAHVVATAYTLSRGAQYMLQQFNIRNRDPPWDVNSDFASIQSDLLYLESVLAMYQSPLDVVAQHDAGGQIDQHSTGPAIFSRALFHLCYCLLHHPFLLRRRLDLCQLAAPASFLSRAFETAREHSKQMIDLLKQVRHAGAIAHTSFYGYCTVVAGTIAGLHLHHISEAKRDDAAVSLQTSIALMEDIARYWKNASSMRLALKRFSEDTFRFAALTSDSVLVEDLTPEDSETLWALVDYSTMSDAAHVVQTQSPDPNFSIYDTNALWQDFFGEFDSVALALVPEGIPTARNSTNFWEPSQQPH